MHPYQHSITIYDIGANNGDDVEYYLKKADKVVAVEANLELCKIISDKYSKHISSGALSVENCALTLDGAGEEIDFYICKENHVLSQVEKPSHTEVFDKVHVKTKSIVDLVRNYGYPYYIKIDIEGSDTFVLRELLQAGIMPTFISAESHTAEIFAILLAIGGYRSFQLVEGSSVPILYNNHKIQTKSGIEHYSFPNHSAGPFGEDIKGDWMNPEDFHKYLGVSGFGWKDIHATTEIIPSPKNLDLGS